jgi:hypothetical protein
VDILSGSREVVASCDVLAEVTPFIHSTPDRVILGDRPVRVFLRCPDEQVELEQVTGSTTGVEAVIVSPREIRVRLLPDAPAIIDGTIEVKTNLPNDDPLRIRVVRYKPA